MKKPKTEKQRERARDQRLRKVYGISLEEYESLLAKSGGVCKICRRPPVTIRLSTDHDHSWKKVRIETTKFNEEWFASATYNNEFYCQKSPVKKSEAVKLLKAELKRASVRGIICVWCNLGLKRYRDSVDSLLSAAKYLEQFSQGSPFSGSEPPR